MAANDLAVPTFSRLPLGLLGFLGIKNGGRYPDQLAGFLQPTWDQLELLGAAHPETGVIAATTAIIQFVQVWTVPQTEVWRVQYASLFIGTGAGETVTAQLAFQNSGGVTGTFALQNPISQIASVSSRWGVRDFWLSPGDVLGVETTAVAGGTIDYSISLRFIRLPN